jgi:hypothetical protein
MKGVERNDCLLLQDLLYPLVYFIIKLSCAQAIRIKKKIHISKSICQLVKGHPPANKSYIKTIIQPLVNAGLTEQSSSEVCLFFKMTLDPGD